jgi:outer membrane protein, heavy metal efflux system
MVRPRWRMSLLTWGLLGLAGSGGCRVAGLGGPYSSQPSEPLDLSIVAETAQSPPPPRPTALREPPGPTIHERLSVPPEIPGSNIAPFQLPPADPEHKVERDRLLKELFESVPGLPVDPVPSDGPLVELTDLQRRALACHPALRSAAAAVESARGAAIQAGLPPNPVFGFEADTIGSGSTAGQQGAKYEQLIKTAGKLKLAQAAALVDVVNAQVAYRRTEIDVATQIRSAYFGVLVAEESLRLAHALSRFAEAMFRVQVDQVRAGQAAAYEPIALRALVGQARVTLTQAQNHYYSAWRQLGAAIGQPDLPVGRVAGYAAMGEPELPYETIRDRMLCMHTDLVTAANSVIKARYNLTRAKITPIPDVALKVVVQKDFTTPPFATCANVEVGVPIPVWDRNQGGIQQASADVSKSLEDIPKIKLDLLTKLADATERYQNNRQIVDTYLLHVLPDQVRAYRGIVQRSQQEPDRASFGDIVTAQQQLNTFLATYLAALQAQWQAAVDLGALGQLDDLYEFGPAKLGEADVEVPAEPPKK